MSERAPHPAGPGSRPAPRRQPAAVSGDGELLTQADVERRILRLCDELDELTHELARKADAAAQAEADYKMAWHSHRTIARASLDGYGPGGRVTNDEADDYAMEDDRAGDLYRIYKIADAAYAAARDALKAKTSQIDALRTVAANIRGQT